MKRKVLMRNCDEYEEELNACMSSPMSVIRIENEIYFYSLVNPESILSLILHLKDAAKLSRDMMLRFPENNRLGVDIKLPIIIHINSMGGSVYDALAAVDTIEQYKNSGLQIHTIIEGCAFSAATVLAICGNKRLITENSSYMIHEMSSTGFNGNLTAMEKLTKSMKSTTDTFEKIYAKYSKMNKTQIKKLVKSEEYLGAEKVLELGLVDEILA